MSLTIRRSRRAALTKAPCCPRERKMSSALPLIFEIARHIPLYGLRKFLVRALVLFDDVLLGEAVSNVARVDSPLHRGLRFGIAELAEFTD
jgi:hypothetical protein